jgi:hypothetical protein
VSKLACVDGRGEVPKVKVAKAEAGLVDMIDVCRKAMVFLMDSLRLRRKLKAHNGGCYHLNHTQNTIRQLSQPHYQDASSLFYHRAIKLFHATRGTRALLV